MNQSIIAQRVFDILLVEDSEDDVVLTQYAFKDVPIAYKLHVVGDGMEALAFLRQESPYDDAPRPDIMLLDLNMPRMDGRELLAEVKSDDKLKTIPAIILTTSSAETDVVSAYRSFAAAYMTKPFGLDVYRQNMRRFVDFWLTDTARLPTTAVTF
jgi:two-component system, chemotaxis family, response regulator Rcp1